MEAMFDGFGLDQIQKISEAASQATQAGDPSLFNSVMQNFTMPTAAAPTEMSYGGMPAAAGANATLGAGGTATDAMNAIAGGDASGFGEDGSLSGWGDFLSSPKGIMAGFGILNNFMQMRNANKMLDFNKDMYADQKANTQTNMANQAQTMNTFMEDRQRGVEAFRGGNQGDIDARTQDYMNRNKITV